MYHLRLKKALSYTGIVSASKEQPDVFVKQEKIAKAAIATGYFERIEEEQQPKEQETSESLENEGENEIDYGTDE